MYHLFGRIWGIDRDPYQLRTRLGQAFDLNSRRNRIGSIRVGHRLNNYWGISTHDNGMILPTHGHRLGELAFCWAHAHGRRLEIEILTHKVTGEGLLTNQKQAMNQESTPDQWHKKQPPPTEQLRLATISKFSVGARRKGPYLRPPIRSEERRVGKEGRSRWCA